MFKFFQVQDIPPLLLRRLHFAGEHTSAHSFATVHGALESGERVAKDAADRAAHDNSISHTVD